MWNLIRERHNSKTKKNIVTEKLVINNSLVNDAQEIANTFSEHFIDGVNQIKSLTFAQNCQPIPTQITNNPKSVFILLFTTHKIINIINSF
jgi:hypothetical protein